MNAPMMSNPGRNGFSDNGLYVLFEPRHPMFVTGQPWGDKYARLLGVDPNHPVVSPAHTGLHENTHTPAVRHDPAHRFLPDVLTRDRSEAESSQRFLGTVTDNAKATRQDAERAAELWRQLDRVEPDSAEYGVAAAELGRLPAELWRRDNALITWHAYREVARKSTPHPLESDPRWVGMDDARVESDLNPYAASAKAEALADSGVDVSLFGDDASDTAKAYVDASPLDLDAFMNASDGLVATFQDFVGRVDPEVGVERRSAPSRTRAPDTPPSNAGDTATTPVTPDKVRSTPTTRPAPTSTLAAATAVARAKGTHTADAKATAVLRLLSDTMGPAARTTPTPGRGSTPTGSLPPAFDSRRKETGPRLRPGE